MAEMSNPQEINESILKAQIDAVRKEESELRLKEIREREEHILNLDSELRNLKNTLEQKEQHIFTLNEQLSALQSEFENTRSELKGEIDRHVDEINALKQSTVDLEKVIDEKNRIIDEQQAEITRKNQEIMSLNGKFDELSATLAGERDSHAKQIDRMNSDFAEKTKAAENNFFNQLSAKQTEFDEVCASHSKELAQVKSDYEKRIEKINSDNSAATSRLKADYEGKISAMQADYNSQIKDYKKQIETITAENAKTVKELNDNHAKEIKAVNKAADKRVSDFEKETEKKMNDTISDIKKKAKAEVAQAEKMAKEKIAEAKGENKLFKKKKEVFAAAYELGSVGLMAMLAEKYASEGRTEYSDHLITAASAIKAIMIAQSPKGLTLTMYTHGSAKLLKLYEGVSNYEVAIGDTVSSFGGVDGQPVFISFADVDGKVAEELAAKIKETADCKVIVSQNRRIQTTGLIGLYFCGE